VAPFLFTHLRLMHVTQTSENQSQADQPESTAPTKKSSRKSILAFAVFALGINSTAAYYTLSPSDFALPDLSKLAELIPHELLPHQRASDPISDPAVAALKNIQSAQQQHVASLQENSFLLQQNTDLLQQGSMTLASLRQSVVDERADVKKISSQITDEHADVKKVSAQISTLIAKVDTLQKTIAPEVTSSIPTRHARNRLSRAAQKRMARQPKPVGPISLGGAPLTLPATTASPQG
jgi:hypothetical protein